MGPGGSGDFNHSREKCLLGHCLLHQVQISCLGQETSVLARSPLDSQWHFLCRDCDELCLPQGARELMPGPLPLPTEPSHGSTSHARPSSVTGAGRRRGSPSHHVTALTAHSRQRVTSGPLELRPESLLPLLHGHPATSSRQLKPSFPCSKLNVPLVCWSTFMTFILGKIVTVQ